MPDARLEARLDDSVLSHLGKIVCGRPLYGWGWTEGEEVENERTNFQPIEVPSVFHFTVESFFDWNEERRGGIGFIHEPNHPYSENWLLFYTRSCGLFDFQSVIADYNFHIGRNKPQLHPHSRDPKMAERWPLPNFPNCRSVWGFGRIAASHEIIVNFEEERIREWKARQNETK